MRDKAIKTVSMQIYSDDPVCTVLSCKIYIKVAIRNNSYDFHLSCFEMFNNCSNNSSHLLICLKSPPTGPSTLQVSFQFTESHIVFPVHYSA